MDRWLFQTCRASRFRRLVSHGLPAQELHDALGLVRSQKHQQAINVDCSHMTKEEFNTFLDELRGTQFSIGVEIYRTEDGLTGLMYPGPVIPVDPIKERLYLKTAHEKGTIISEEYEGYLSKIESEIRGAFGVRKPLLGRQRLNIMPGEVDDPVFTASQGECDVYLEKISPANLERETAEFEQEDDDE